MAGIGFLLAVIISTLILIAMLVSVPIEVSQRPEITYIMGGCTASQRSVDEESYIPAKQDFLKINSTSDSIIIERGLNHLCCLNISFAYTEKNALVEIFEIQQGSPCRCVCYSSINATLSPLSTGKYIVRYYSVINRTDIPYQEDLINSTEIYVI